MKKKTKAEKKSLEKKMQGRSTEGSLVNALHII
jgi:hypothetical protein